MGANILYRKTVRENEDDVLKKQYFLRAHTEERKEWHGMHHLKEPIAA
jgi:hypothetical protein